MLALGGHNIISVRTLAHDTNIQSRFLFDFTARASLNRFTPLKMPSWKRPRAGTVRAAAQAQQHLTAAYHEDAHADLRPCRFARNAHFKR